jgi:hypothetical protein
MYDKSLKTIPGQKSASLEGASPSDFATDSGRITGNPESDGIASLEPHQLRLRGLIEGDDVAP